MVDFLADVPMMRVGKTGPEDGKGMHKERFVIDDRRMHGDGVPRGKEGTRELKQTTESLREHDGGRALSDGMRTYILGYGGPITAECTNPLVAAS